MGSRFPTEILKPAMDSSTPQQIEVREGLRGPIIELIAALSTAHQSEPSHQSKLTSAVAKTFSAFISDGDPRHKIGSISLDHFAPADPLDDLQGINANINLAGPAQPDAARLLVSIFDQAFKRCDINVNPHQVPVRYKMSKESDERGVKFTVPYMNAKALTDYVKVLVKRLKRPIYAGQVFAATEFSGDIRDKIEGIKSSVGYIDKDNKVQFVIQLQHVPDELARELLPVLKQAASEQGDELTGLKHSKSANGQENKLGRDVMIPMGSSHTKELLRLINIFAENHAKPGAAHVAVAAHLTPDPDTNPLLDQKPMNLNPIGQAY